MLNGKVACVVRIDYLVVDIVRIDYLVVDIYAFRISIYYDFLSQFNDDA